MKRAFTLTELIFVLIIVGILSVSAVSRSHKDTLVPAANQVLDHIRYTQQLALNQDMFVPSPNFSTYSDPKQKEKDSKQWFKKWWRIQFHGNNSYTLYSDHPSKNENNHQYDADDDKSDDVARDPLSGLYLYKKGHSNSDYQDDERLTLVDLFEEYEVTANVQGCGNSDHILFDNMGRPHCSKSRGDSSLYPYSQIRQDGNFINVTLTHSKSGESKTICVTPVSGYAYISQNNSCL